MIRKAYDYIKKYNMVEKGDRIVLGVSGGADSVCLLYVLKQLSSENDMKLIVVHVNHGIRGNEAKRDEHFVAALCSCLDIEFYKYSYEVKKIAKVEGLSEEEAGRKVRYQAFLEVCKRDKCNKIAIAHNKNDNAETILFHLFRGSGIKGLSGIEPVHTMNTDFGDIKVIRPLLSVARLDIEEFLHQQGISYQTDSTNLTDDYTRNKIRNRVITYVTKEINLGAVSNITGAAAQLREIEEFVNANIEMRYHALVHKSNQIYLISVHDFRNEPVVIQKGIIRRILEELAGNRKDLEAKHVDQVISLCDKQVGRYVHLPYGMIAQREYNDLKFFRKNDTGLGNKEEERIEPITLEIPGTTYIPQNKKSIETKVINMSNRDDNFIGINDKKYDPIPKSSCAKWFDYDKIENAVEIRTRKEGDYIQINCMGGRKKLKDYFIDQKVPCKERDSQLLITDGNHIMWIPGNGERMSEKYKVDDTTNRILLMKFINAEEK